MGVEMSMPGWKSRWPVKGSMRLPKLGREVAADRPDRRGGGEEDLLVLGRTPRAAADFSVRLADGLAPWLASELATSAEGGVVSRLETPPTPPTLRVGQASSRGRPSRRASSPCSGGSVDLGLELRRRSARRPGSSCARARFSVRSRRSSSDFDRDPACSGRGRRRARGPSAAGDADDPLRQPDRDLELAEPGLGVGHDDEGVELVGHHYLSRVSRTSRAGSHAPRRHASARPSDHPEQRPGS